MKTKGTLNICKEVLDYACIRGYKGYNKFDGLESPITKKLSFNNRWARLFWSQLVMRFPINIRPLLAIKKARNPKGIALFAQALLELFEATQEEQYLKEAELLLEWLIKNPSSGFEHPCWGYQFAWQDIGFYAPAHFPNRVVTSFVCRALLKGYKVTGNTEYLDTVSKSAQFIMNSPKVLFESETMKCLSYVPDERINWIVMDVSALCGAVLAELSKETDNAHLAHEAKKLIYYVVDKQTDYGAWFYTHPPKDSHIGHDNYHTGYIVDAIQNYMNATGDESYKNAHDKGLKFYSENLFEKNGAPKWMSNKNYPFDIHGAAQGIITFSRYPRYHTLVEKILTWTIQNMYSGEGYFYYQKGRFYTKKFTLMRWCNAWMAKAMVCRLVK